MSDIEKIVLELLVVEYDWGGNWVVVNVLWKNGFGNNVVDYEIVLWVIVVVFELQWQIIEFNEDGDLINVLVDIFILVLFMKCLGMIVVKWNLFDGWEIEMCFEWVGMYCFMYWQLLFVELEVV